MQISEIRMSQRRLRSVEQLTGMIRTLRDGGSLPRILLFRDEEGFVQVGDGHHRLSAIWLSGRTTLREDEFLLVESETFSPRFGQVTDLLERCGIRLDGETEIIPRF